MSHMRTGLLITYITILIGCASIPTEQCPTGTQNLPDCPPANAINDEDINKLHASRTWIKPSKLTIDPIQMGKDAQIPVNNTRIKIIGPGQVDALNSLAAKIWLIDNAQHTIDLTYYIFKTDMVGYAVLGALCNAVQRGVDIRIMVDSLGSFSFGHNPIRALETCAEKAGFIRNLDGQVTTKKARVQAVIFNALSNFEFNRRSHDKLLVVDGHISDKAFVMTGGRNISVSYYGIKDDGSEDPTAFRDLEILLRPQKNAPLKKITVGSASEIYYSLLFVHKGNRRIHPKEIDQGVGEIPDDTYSIEREKSQKQLAFLKSLPAFEERYNNMHDYMNEGFHDSRARLAHEMANLTNTDVTTNVEDNLRGNPNSIVYMLAMVTENAINTNAKLKGTLRIVSPYLFVTKYFNDEGDVIHDGAQKMLAMLRNNPDLKMEIITNSVLTSDNVFAQAIIDMDMGPRLLLTPELEAAWVSGLKEGEQNPAVVQSKEWQEIVKHPQLLIYQTGKLDSIMLGKGKTHYGKLHAKYILGETIAFVGTSNFDYRSMLYNNEMGFFLDGAETKKELLDIFETLKATSYRWGSPEWLQMRKELMASESKKASPTRKQRIIFKTTKGLGVEYLM